jgi:hypothetical protein
MNRYGRWVKQTFHWMRIYANFDSLIEYRFSEWSAPFCASTLLLPSS